MENIIVLSGLILLFIYSIWLISWIDDMLDDVDDSSDDFLNKNGISRYNAQGLKTAAIIILVCSLVSTLILIWEMNPLWHITDFLSNKVVIIVFSIFLLIIIAWVQSALNNATFKSSALKYVNYVLLGILSVFTIVKFFIPAAKIMRDATPQDIFTQYKQEKNDIRERDISLKQKYKEHQTLRSNTIKDLNKISQQSQQLKSRITSERKPNLSSRKKSGTWANIRRSILPS